MRNLAAMDVTLLGSSESIGVPFPLCDCEHCLNSQERRRPGLLVRTDEVTLVFDTNPDIKEQLHQTGVTEVDGFFITHAHGDHLRGIKDIYRATAEPENLVRNPESFEYPVGAKDIIVYGNEHTKGTIDEWEHIQESIEYHVLADEDAVEVGDVLVRSFPVFHGHEGSYPTMGFAIEAGGEKVVYVPDLHSFLDDEDYGDNDVFKDASLLFIDGAVLGAEFHAPTEVLRRQIERARADRVVLTNLNEHTFRMSTEEIEAAAADLGYEAWADFDSATL